MQESARGGFQTRKDQVYNRAGRPCPRCGARIERRGQWDDNRTTYWCPGCQR
jgi:endonuclease-8